MEERLIRVIRSQRLAPVDAARVFPACITSKTGLRVDLRLREQHRRWPRYGRIESVVIAA
ncbi:hypothetical protein GCM10020216_042330 [Nonomuraea helvata]